MYELFKKSSRKTNSFQTAAKKEQILMIKGRTLYSFRRKSFLQCSLAVHCILINGLLIVVCIQQNVCQLKD